MKKGLVLEGGAMRGMFTAGVLDVLMENHIDFDGMVGTSAGALFGSGFKSRQIGRGLRYNLKYCNDKRYGSFRSLIATGDYYNRKFCYYKIPIKLDPFDRNTFKENPIEFYVTATDVERGITVYHKTKSGGQRDVEWMRASASMPGFANVVEIDGYKLLDGGITDSIPLEFMEKKGYKKNLVVLTRPEGYRKKKTKFDLPFRLVLRKYPAVIREMKLRTEKYNQQLTYIENQAKAGNVLIIQPPKSLEISRTEHNREKLLNVYKIGREAAFSKLPEIRAFLSEE